MSEQEEERLTFRERKAKVQAKYFGRMKRAVLGIFAGPVTIVSGQTIVNGWNMVVIAGWIITVVGVSVLIISAGYGVFAAFAYDEEKP